MKGLRSIRDDLTRGVSCGGYPARPSASRTPSIRGGAGHDASTASTKNANPSAGKWYQRLASVTLHRRPRQPSGKLTAELERFGGERDSGPVLLVGGIIAALRRQKQPPFEVTQGSTKKAKRPKPLHPRNGSGSPMPCHRSPEAHFPGLIMA